jgi:hypothetical protein
MIAWVCIHAIHDEGRSVAHHPNKHIRDAIEYAISQGWTLKKSGPRAHIWGRLYCPQGDRGGCAKAVYSTPKDAQDHAKDIRRAVRRCRHQP